MNIIYENVILPMDHTVLNCQQKGFLSQIHEYRGLHLQAQKRITVKPGFQKIVESGISCNIPEKSMPMQRLLGKCQL